MKTAKKTSAIPREKSIMNNHQFLMRARAFVVICFCSFVFIQVASASDPVPAAKQKKPIALVGGTIYTVSGGVIQNGTVVFDKGKIVAVGVNVTIPAGSDRIDVSGKRIYPGVIDANTI